VARRFQSMHVEPPKQGWMRLEIIKGRADRYEANHRVQILDEALEAAWQHCRIGHHPPPPDRCLPDQAIDVLDEGVAQDSSAQQTKPTNCGPGRAIERLSIQKDEAVRNAEYEEAGQNGDHASSPAKHEERDAAQWREKAKKSMALLTRGDRRGHQKR